MCKGTHREVGHIPTALLSFCQAEVTRPSSLSDECGVGLNSACIPFASPEVSDFAFVFAFRGCCFDESLLAVVLVRSSDIDDGPAVLAAGSDSDPGFACGVRPSTSSAYACKSSR